MRVLRRTSITEKSGTEHLPASSADSVDSGKLKLPISSIMSQLIKISDCLVRVGTPEGNGSYSLVELRLHASRCASDGEQESIVRHQLRNTSIFGVVTVLSWSLGN
jgi:hypothetical protein